MCYHDSDLSSDNWRNATAMLDKDNQLTISKCKSFIVKTMSTLDFIDQHIYEYAKGISNFYYGKKK